METQTIAIHEKYYKVFFCWIYMGNDVHIDVALILFHFDISTIYRIDRIVSGADIGIDWYGY